MKNLETYDRTSRTLEEIYDNQLEVALRALHVIAALPSTDANFLSEVALDALKEMETYGLLYNGYDDELDY
mgnify:FL=1|tara:strand:+ start:313 stop:525 length:213 start_codon:yes stop_codon:yes gene_type:complete